MESKLQLRKNLKKIRRNQFYSKLVKILLLLVFVIITPISIYEKFLEGDILTVTVLFIAELGFIGFVIMLGKSAFEFINMKKSRILQCVDNPNLVTEIIVTPHKIVFEIKGMEDETIFLKQSDLKSEILVNIKEVFGETKIINNY